MSSPDTDPDVATARAAALAFLASRNLAELAHLGLPPSEMRHTGDLLRDFAGVPEVAELTLGGLATWLAHQGNPGFGYGIALLLEEIWRRAGTPMQRSRGDALVTAAYACNRAGWPQRTLELADPWHGRNADPIGGEPVAVHLELLAAEAHWLLRNIAAARKRMPSEPPEAPGAASLWSVMRQRLDELAQKGSGTELPLAARWEQVCRQALGQVDQLLAMFPPGSTSGSSGDTHGMLAALRERFLRETASPPTSEPELLQRVGDLTETLTAILGGGGGSTR